MDVNPDVDLKGPPGDGFEKLAFRMRLHPGAADDYRRRHDEISAELVSLLKQAGVSDYSIHLDPDDHSLFAVLWRRRDHGMDALRHHPAMRLWWSRMADIMDTHPSDEPVCIPLQTVFHLA